MKTFFKIVLLAFLVYFFSWVLVYYSGINKFSIQSEDTIPAIFLPVAIIKDHTIHLDKYYEMMRLKYPHPDDKNFRKDLTPYYLRKVGSNPRRAFEVRKVNAVTMFIKYDGYSNHFVSAFPIISGLMGVPVYAAPVMLGMPITWDNLIILSHVTSALIVALSGGFFYLLAKSAFSLSNKKAELITYIYLFGTINYALISQAVWQHGTLQLFTIISLLLFFRGIKLHSKDRKRKWYEKSIWYLYLAGFFLGVAFLARPTAALYWPFLFLLLYQGQYKKPFDFLRSCVAFFSGLIPVALFFFWYTKKYYYSVLNQGYADQAPIGWLSSIPEGSVGLWLSPSRGLLVYSPVVIFSLVGLWIALKDIYENKKWNENLKYLLFGLIIFLHSLVLGKWKHWYGGWSFGYRMASDILPFLILLLVPYINSDIYKKTKKIFYGLFAFSVLVQVYGIVFFDGVWHAAYDRGFENTSWLWSIKNSELVFNIRRVLVKFGLLDKACLNCLPGK